MGALFYLIKHTVINYIKSLKKKPGLIVMYAFFSAVVVLLLFAGAHREFDQRWLSNDIRSIVFGLLSLLVGYIAVSSGLKAGSTFFRMADVNLIFPSPIGRRPILVYGFIRQLGISFLVVLYLLFQIANIQNLFGIPYDRLWIFFTAALTAVLYIPVCSMVIHASVLRRPSRKRVYKHLLTAFFGILCILFVYYLLRSKDPIDAAYRVVGTKPFGYIPLIGWLKTMLEASAVGFSTPSILSGVLLASGFIALVWYLFHSDMDYFEDVLRQTEYREQRIADKREGRTVRTQSGRIRKAHSFYRGGGPSALFYRQQLEYRKSGFFLLDKASLILAVIGLAMAYFLRDNPLRMEYILYASVYILFILSMTGRWSSELKTPYIYLIPGKPLAKLWYATLSNHIKHLVDGFVLFMIVGQIFTTPLIHRMLLAGCYASFGALYVYGDVLFMRLFGSSHENIAAGMLKLFSIAILALPALAIVIAGMLLAHGSLSIIGLSYACVIAYAATVSLLVMLLGKRIFASES